MLSVANWVQLLFPSITQMRPCLQTQMTKGGTLVSGHRIDRVAKQRGPDLDLNSNMQIIKDIMKPIGKSENRMDT